jgi:transcriptional regulator with XRE-family HTH domain
MTLEKTLATILKDRHLSLSKLSELSGVPKTTLHSWMKKGQITVNLKQLKQVCEILKIGLHELAFGETDPLAMPSDEIIKEIFSGDLRVSISRIERKKRET